jgi:hypothetical protein
LLTTGAARVFLRSAAVSKSAVKTFAARAVLGSGRLSSPSSLVRASALFFCSPLAMTWSPLEDAFVFFSHG